MSRTQHLARASWERTSVEAQEYIRALEACVAALEATVQQGSPGGLAAQTDDSAPLFAIGGLMRHAGLFYLMLQLLLLLNVSTFAQTSRQQPGLMPTEQTLTMTLKIGSSFFLFIPRPGGTAYYWDFDKNSSRGNFDVYPHEVRVLRYPTSEPQVGSADGDLFEIRGSTPGRATIVFGFRQYRQDPISRIRIETKIEE